MQIAYLLSTYRKHEFLHVWKDVWYVKWMYEDEKGGEVWEWDKDRQKVTERERYR